MAGMFSLLRKSQLRLDMAASSVGGEDSTSDFRKKSSHRSPLPGKRILRQVHLKTMAGSSDRVPKRFRKRRCSEMHPLLRRSVCTLLLAGCGITAGLIIVLVDHHSYNTISNAGIIVLTVSAFIFIIGIIWFWWSSIQLRNLRKKLLAMQTENETRREKVSSCDELYRTKRGYDPAALSASKWPTKRVAPEEQSDTSDANISPEDTFAPYDKFQTRHPDIGSISKNEKKLSNCLKKRASSDSDNSVFDNEPTLKTCTEYRSMSVPTGYENRDIETPRICVSSCGHSDHVVNL